MKVKRFTAPNMQTALRQVSLELGADAVIVSTQKTAKGIEVVAALDYQSHRGAQEVERQLQLQHELELAKQDLQNTQRQQRMVTAKRADVSSHEGLVAALSQLKQPSNKAATPLPRAAARPTLSAPVLTVASTPSHQAAAAVTSAAENGKALNQMQLELRELKHLLLAQAQTSTPRVSAQAQSQADIQARCQQLGLMPRLTRALSAKVTHLDHDQAWQQVLTLLTNNLPIATQKMFEHGGRYALLGPSGAGKTTTIGKIAAQYVLRHGPADVALVTLDSYRVAAHDQLRSFAKILGVELKIVPPSGDLNKELDVLRHKKLVLVDSAGLSKQDPHFSTQLAMLRRTGGRVQKLLVMPLTSQERGLHENYEQFKLVELAGCIFTKLDECFSLGAALSVATLAKLPITLVTNGPHIPNDIHYPNAAKLVKLAERMAKPNANPWHANFNAPTHEPHQPQFTQHGV